MGHEHDQKPQIDILVDEEQAEPVKIIVDPGANTDEATIQAEVAKVAGSIDAVVDSGVFTHWVDGATKKAPPPKAAKPKKDQEPVEGYDAIFAADSALDDGAGIPIPQADEGVGDGGGDDGGGAGDDAPNPSADPEFEDYLRRKRAEEEADDDDGEGPPPDDDDNKNGPDVL